jgi:FAD binding domain
MPFSPAGPQSLSIRRRLRAAVDGRVVTADDADYDQARALFYGGFDRRPRAIVWPTDTAEVAQVVSLAAERRLELAVRGGGHSSAGHSVCDGGSCSTCPSSRRWRSTPPGGPPGRRPA